MYLRQPAVRRVIAWQTRGVDSRGPRNGIVYLSLERRSVEIGEARACFRCDSRVYLHVRRHHVARTAATRRLSRYVWFYISQSPFHGRATSS